MSIFYQTNSLMESSLVGSYDNKTKRKEKNTETKQRACTNYLEFIISRISNRESSWDEPQHSGLSNNAGFQSQGCGQVNIDCICDRTSITVPLPYHQNTPWRISPSNIDVVAASKTPEFAYLDKSPRALSGSQKRGMLLQQKKNKKTFVNDSRITYEHTIVTATLYFVTHTKIVKWTIPKYGRPCGISSCLHILKP